MLFRSLWKIPSGEVQNQQLLKKIAETKKPLLVSSGMSSLAELDQAINLIREYHDQFVLMQCTTSYPCPPSSIGLNILEQYKRKYCCEVGLSDHSGTIYPGLAAATLGAKVIEVHVTFNKDMFGYDATSSISMEQLKILVEGVNFIDQMLKNPIDKDQQSNMMSEVKSLFQKSIFVRRAINEGEIFSEDSFILKKPGTGIPASLIDMVIGKKSRIYLEPGKILRWEDIE